MIKIDKPIIYLDNAATTPLLDPVKEVMTNTFAAYGNPSSLYQIGQDANKIIEDSRESIADYIGCSPQEIIFESCGSEANTHALFSTYDYAQAHGLGNHIIASKIEHHSILAACEYLRTYRGAAVTYLDVDKDGFIDIHQLEKSINLNTCLISIMAANNEVGTIQNIKEIKRIADAYGLIFHSDCVQLFGHAPLHIDDIDLFSMSGHKIGAPKGIGLLFIKHTTPILPYIFGTQERGLRGGTQNTAYIAALAEAVRQLPASQDDVRKLSDYMRNRILAEIPGVWLNGPMDENRLANNLNFSFAGIRGEELMILLDMYGICVSTGSACNSSSGESSHVLTAMGLTNDEADSSIRISFSPQNTIKEIDFTVNRMKELINQLRSR